MSESKHVFASYVREDYETVTRLASKLSEAGVTVWLDRNEIQPGSRWKRVITRAIRDGGFFLACFSKHYTDRAISYMNEELTLAIELIRQMPVDRPWFIPILLDDCDVPEREIGAGETLRDIQYVALFQDWDDGIGRILRVIQPTTKTTAVPKTPNSSIITTVLFLASNPIDTRPLRLDAELREVQGAILSSQFRDKIRLEMRLAVTPTDLARSILDLQPNILHFSGHGSSGFLVLEDKTGRSVNLDTKMLFEIIIPFSDKIQCVVLNSTDSQSLAKDLVKKIDFVVGMSSGLTDSAAIVFSAGFYQALGNGRSIPDAFELGCAMIRLEGFESDTMPLLFKRSTDAELG